MTTERSQYDVAVIGAGPAGCAAAIAIKTAHPRASVLLLEKGGFPRHKVCGEFISPEALDLLGRLAGNAAEIERAPRISCARLMLAEREIDLPLEPPAISLPRHQLDALLWSRASAVGVQCLSNTHVRNVVEGNGPFSLEVGGDKILAQALVNATGRWSNLSSQTRVPATKWLGLKAHFAESPAGTSVDLYFFRGGYCGVQPVAADGVNVCAMVRADVATNLSEVFRQHPALHSRSRSWRPLTETFATTPLLFRPPRALKGRVLLAGDAVGFIDPFLGDGISLALRSGSMAGKAVAEFCTGKVTLERALADYDRAYRRHLSPAFSRAAGLRRLLDLPAALRTPLIKMARLPGMAAFIFRQTRGSNSPLELHG
jgi:flavin-dependent dehydrogenase